jgi:hypothetical protein
MLKNFYCKDAKYAKKEKQCLMLLSALRGENGFMLKNFYRKDAKYAKKEKQSKGRGTLRQAQGPGFLRSVSLSN